MKNVAVIGSGIAGMSCAYFLCDKYNVTVYEKNDYVGGHTNTVEVQEGDEKIPIDTGFMVFNEHTYPNLIKLFDKLKVKYTDTDMSFSVKDRISGLEYNGSDFNGLFAQRKNLASPSFYRLLLQINKFNEQAVELLDNPVLNDITIYDYLKLRGYHDDLFYKYLAPMSSAVWSTPIEKMKSFNANNLIRFFKNHGFLGMNTQYQWKTIPGGSQNYRKKIIDKYKTKIRTESPVIKVSDKNDYIDVTTDNGQTEKFDYVFIASHADEALDLLESPTDIQSKLLSPFKYQKNIATLHTDHTVMPKEKRAWSSWNYVIDNTDAYTVYYMNKLQNVSKNKEYFININGEEFVDQDKILKRIIYHHPVFNESTANVQPDLKILNSHHSKIFFTGSYFRYGFHEDALWSSVELCKQFLGEEVL